MNRVQITLLLIFMLSLFCEAKKCETQPKAPNRDYYQIFDSPLVNTHYVLEQTCTFHIEAEESDIIKVEFFKVSLRDVSGNCDDMVTVYDGTDTWDTKLRVICNYDTAVIESSGKDLRFEFKTTGHYYKGRAFRMKYKSAPRGQGGQSNTVDDDDDDNDDDNGLPIGAIIAIAAIPTTCLYGIIGFVIYRRCKYTQRIQRNLAVTGHTAQDLRMAMVTMLDQASRGPLIQNNGQQNHRANDVRLAAANMMNQASQGPIVPGQNPLQNNLLQHMDEQAARRGNRRGQERRTRHPAGDDHHHNATHHPSNATAFLSTNQQPNEERPDSYSNNNVMANNNTAANLNYEGANSYPSPYTIPYTSDPSMVYYAGDIDEHGHLHAPDNFDRVSHGSGSAHRSGGSGRNSPRGPHTAPGRRSPRRYHDPRPEHPDTITCYGIIDQPSQQPSAPLADEEHGGGYEMPPPSYEEVTGRGRRSPHNFQSQI